MKIGGFQPFSLIDYPSKIAAVLFTQGCNFRCPYCHNPELVLPELFMPLYEESAIWDFLEKRRGRLDGVVVTGGEPTQQPDLLDFAVRVKAMGYLFKLDTNGSAPEVLREGIARGLFDYVAMDLKAPLEKYAWVAGTPVRVEAVRESMELLLASSIEHEFRTTYAKDLLTEADLGVLKAMTSKARKYSVQDCLRAKRLLAEYAP
ncbi:MAG: anaerobic ribonucleoside-triphosphate reductase activating protein [Candidatus Omnitrophota bacterium]